MQKVSFTKNSLGSKSGNNAVLFAIPASLFTLPPFSSKENSIVCTAFSEHSFMSKEGKFVNLKRDYPIFFDLLKEQSELK